MPLDNAANESGYSEQELEELKRLVSQLSSKRTEMLRKYLDGEIDTELPPKIKPQGWSLRSHSPYYHEKFARELKEILDRMLVSRKNQIFAQENFKKVKRNTIYIKINQAWRYLCDKLDPDGVYKKLAEEAYVKKDHPVGVAIILFENEQEKLIAIEDAGGNSRLEWKERVDDFLTNGKEGEKLELTDYVLDDKDVADLELQLTPISLEYGGNILFSVARKKIKIIKPTAEQRDAILKGSTPA